MLRYASILLIAIAAGLCSVADLFAQQQGFGGSAISGSGGGGFGGGGGGGGSSGGGFGSSSGGGSGGGLTLANASSSLGGFGQLGLGASNGFGATTTAQSMYGGRTYGATTTAGGGMTGSTTGTNRTSSTSSSSSAGRNGQASGGGRRRNSGTTGQQAGGKQQQPWFEPRIEVGFDVVPVQKSAVMSHVSTSLGSAKAGSPFADVRIVLDGDTAILRGVVVSQNDRQLAEQIALLEPAISTVRNELTVRKQAAAAAAPTR